MLRSLSANGIVVIVLKRFEDRCMCVIEVVR
jgi:hypothetical protein